MKQSSFVPLHGEGRQLIHKGGGGGEERMTKVFEEFLGWSHFQFSVESKSILLWFSFTSFCDWSTKLAPLSQPIRCKTKNNRDFVIRVFARFRQFACFNLESSLATDDVNLFSD